MTPARSAPRLSGAAYDAWLIKIGEGGQFGSGFVAVNPNSKIPALIGRSGLDPIRVFEPDAILLYLAERSGAFLPNAGGLRAEWLFWRIGSAPYLGGGFAHFYAYAPTKTSYAMARGAGIFHRSSEGERGSTRPLPATRSRQPPHPSGCVLQDRSSARLCFGPAQAYHPCLYSTDTQSSGKPILGTTGGTRA